MKKIYILTLMCISLEVSATIETGNSFLKTAEESRNSVILRQYVNGYIAGMYDAYEDGLAKCLGDSVRMSQIVDALRIYLEKNPQLRHYAMSDLFVPAVKSVFNCK